MDVHWMVEGQELVLMPERALYFPKENALLVADVHLGKVGTFRQHGIPLPEALADADLARLAGALERSGAQKLVVLGDLIHGRMGLTPSFVAKMAAWRAQFPVPMVLVEGNHDRHAPQLPSEWKVEVVRPDMRLEPFLLSHAPQPNADCFVLCGHLHPMMRLARGSLQVRLPCFWLEPQRMVLPAFSDFTGGPQLPYTDGTRVFVIVDGRVIALKDRLRSERERSG